jgi:hypothetical protein
MKKLLFPGCFAVVAGLVPAQTNPTTETTEGLGVAEVPAANTEAPAFYRQLRRPVGFFCLGLSSQFVVGKFAHIQGR